MEISPEKLDNILQEISGYEIELVEDPTLPEYGYRYLQKAISQCRNHMNRVQYYLQVCNGQEKKLRREFMIQEADIDLKLKEMLSENPTIKRLPSIEDRKAAATSLLREEFVELSRINVLRQDLIDTIKIIKLKYNDLRATNSDIKLQRQMIRDDRDMGGEGTSGAGPGRRYPNGMPPEATRPKINPEDLLNDDKRPEDMPKPKDLAHAKMIASFYNNLEEESSGEDDKEEETETKTVTNSTVSYEDLVG